MNTSFEIEFVCVTCDKIRYALNPSAEKCFPQGSKRPKFVMLELNKWDLNDLNKL